MEIQLSFSFSDFKIKNELLEIMKRLFTFKKIEIEKNFEWHTVDSFDILKDEEFTQAKFKLRKGGDKILIQNLNNSLPRVLGDGLSKDSTELFLKEINSFHDYIVYAFINESIDYVLCNTDSIENWRAFDKPMPQSARIVKNPLYIEGNPGMDMISKEYIDLESLPCHKHQMDYGEKLWFGCCWKMYFSPVYYKYIPKPLFDDFKDCYENIVLDNGLRRITLFKNIEDYDLTENREKQWALRKALGIDSIAHELTYTNNRTEIQNLPVVITKNDCKVGQTKVVRFLDYNHKIISKDKAMFVETKEYSDDGTTILLEHIATV
jgi:hypothetical protein